MAPNADASMNTDLFNRVLKTGRKEQVNHKSLEQQNVNKIRDAIRKEERIMREKHTLLSAEYQDVMGTALFLCKSLVLGMHTVCISCQRQKMSSCKYVLYLFHGLYYSLLGRVYRGDIRLGTGLFAIMGLDPCKCPLHIHSSWAWTRYHPRLVFQVVPYGSTLHVFHDLVGERQCLTMVEEALPFDSPPSERIRIRCGGEDDWTWTGK